jgi:hypothetical protein
MLSMENIKYKTAEELLMDESFLLWYHHTDNEAVRLWNEWIAADPRHRLLADEAVLLLSRIDLKEKGITDTQINTAADRLMRAIGLEVTGLRD